MVAEDIFKPKLSKFTLAVAQDSGWFDTDTQKGDLYIWGKEEGCGFVTNSCTSTESHEICDGSVQSTCSENYLYKSYCHKSMFSDNCFLNLNRMSCKQDNIAGAYFETFGADSMCHPVSVLLIQGFINCIQCLF